MKHAVLQNNPGRYYSEMLLRQMPWLKDILKEEEYPIAFSYRRPERLFAVSLLFIGAFIAADALFHPSAFGTPGIFLLILLIGMLLLYGGFWSMILSRRSYVLVTSGRVIYQKTNLFGRPGKTLVMLRSQIKRARFFKSTVMYWTGRRDGSIAIQLREGQTFVIPSLQNGENILAALRNPVISSDPL